MTRGSELARERPVQAQNIQRLKVSLRKQACSHRSLICSRNRHFRRCRRLRKRSVRHIAFAACGSSYKVPSLSKSIRQIVPHHAHSGDFPQTGNI